MEVAFNEVSFRKWLSRTYNDDGTPKTPNPDVSLIGTTPKREVYNPSTTNPEVLTCVKCGDTWSRERRAGEEWRGEWKCRKCKK